MKPFATLVSVLGLAVAGGVTVVSQQTPEAVRADLVLRGGRIVTLDARVPEAQAIAARGGAIVAVGTNAEIARFIGPATQVVELNGQFAMPGLSRARPLPVSATASSTLELRTRRAGTSRAHGRAAAEGETRRVIIGRGWHQEKWARAAERGRFPTRVADKGRRTIPSSHARKRARVRQREAMRLSNITAATANPAGGEILKDAKGQPTGLLRETASASSAAAPARRHRPRTKSRRADSASSSWRIARRSRRASRAFRTPGPRSKSSIE
jgi:predicted amidohydrolase YtcJ